MILIGGPLFIYYLFVLENVNVYILIVFVCGAKNGCLVGGGLVVELDQFVRDGRGREHAQVGEDQGYVLRRSVIHRRRLNLSNQKKIFLRSHTHFANDYRI